MGEHARKKDSNNSTSSRNWKKGAEIPIGDRIAALETSIRVQREEQARIARVEELRAQVNAGTYKVDSKAIAQKMLKSPEVMKLLGVGKEDLFELKDEE